MTLGQEIIKGLTKLRDVLRSGGRLSDHFKVTTRRLTTEQILAISDEDAIRGDWEVVGNDLQVAMDQLKEEEKQRRIDR